MIRSLQAVERAMGRLAEAVKSLTIPASRVTRYDRRTRAYARHLSEMVQAWRKRAAERNLRDPGDRYVAAGDLIDDMLSSSEMYIPEAFGLGFGSQPMSYQDELLRYTVVARNNANIRERLQPFVVGSLEKTAETDEAGWYDDLQRVESRVDMYVGAYWGAIWAGLGAGLDHLFPTGIGVRRLLNPMAEHCTTCPPKAREYDDWASMLAYCGGVPGDGSDECRSRCRCRLEFVSPHGWTEEIIF